MAVVLSCVLIAESSVTLAQESVPSAPTPDEPAQADAGSPLELEPSASIPGTEPAPAAAAPTPSETKAAPVDPLTKPAKAEEEIVVTGSRIHRRDLSAAAPVTVLSREQFQQSGRLTLGDFLQTLPEQGNAPNFQLNNGGSTYGADGATRINLRSLGITRTLVLINGHRVVPSGLGASAAVDLNTIPASAVERIEVLKDGASAIYGSDAVAGVVNVITRKGFNSTEAYAQYGLSARGDAQTFDVNVTTGRRGELGNFLFSAGFFNQEKSWLRDRSWSSRALTYDYTNQTTSSGGSGRTPSGSASLPQNPDGSPLQGCVNNSLCSHLISLDPQGWSNNAFIRDPSAPRGWRIFQNADRYNFAAENYLTIPSTRFQAYSAGDTQFKYARAYFEASFVYRTSQQNAAPMPLDPADYNLQVSKDSMYNPFGVDLPSAGRRLVEFGHRTYNQDLSTFRILVGIDGKLPEQLGPLQGWSWDVSLNYGRTAGTFTTTGAIRNSRIANALGPSREINGVPRCLRDVNDPMSIIADCVPLNLFGGPNNGSIDPEQINGLGFTGTSRAFDDLLAFDANVTGDLFRLASVRPVALALGYQFRRQAGAQIADPIAASGDSADFNFQSTEGQFTVHEAFGELSAPIVGNLLGVHDLEASLAGRFVTYNTFGSNFSYKAGLRYSPIRDVTLRGTLSTAFRAPTISELYLGRSGTAPTVSDPCNFSADADPALKAQCMATGVLPGGSGDQGLQQLTYVGGNSALKPETAQTFTAGIVIQPRVISNLSVTLDYFHVDVDNVVGTLGAAVILQGCYPGSSSESYQPYCDLITRSSAGRILFISDVNQNVGKLRTGGLDFAARYALPTASLGRFVFSFSGNYLAFFDRTQSSVTGSKTLRGQGTFGVLGALPAVKLNAGINWSFGGLALGVNSRFIGSFKECGALDSTTNTFLSTGGVCDSDDVPSRQVGANIVFDLYAGYTLSSPVGKTMLRAGMNNVFDQAPQFVYAAPLANSDPSIYDFLGRYFYMRVQQTF